MSPDIKKKHTETSTQLATLSQVRLAEIASDFAFTKLKKSEGDLSPKRDTLFVYCVDPKLADQAGKLKKSGGYGFDEAGAFVYPILCDNKDHNHNYSESLKLNFITEYKLILSSNSNLERVIVLGHSFCGAVNSLDFALFTKSRAKENALDEDQIRHLAILGEHTDQFVNIYKQFNDIETGRDDRLRMLERLASLISAENIKQYLFDTKSGMASGIRNDKVRNQLLSERPRIYPCIAYCPSPDHLAHDDIEVFVPEVKDFVKISLVYKALGESEKTPSKNYFDINMIDNKLQALYRQLEDDIASKLI